MAETGGGLAGTPVRRSGEGTRVTLRFALAPALAALAGLELAPLAAAGLPRALARALGGPLHDLVQAANPVQRILWAAGGGLLALGAVELLGGRRAAHEAVLSALVVDAALCATIAASPVEAGLAPPELKAAVPFLLLALAGAVILLAALAPGRRREGAASD